MLGYVAVTSHIGKKLVEGELRVEVTHVKILGHMSVYPICPESYETIFVWVSFFLLLVFSLKVVRGDDFWPHLKMCTNGSDLLPVILNNGTMSGEMRS